eukprot:1746509-Pleurochrysis_carterae.AAC.2
MRRRQHHSVGARRHLDKLVVHLDLLDVVGVAHAEAELGGDGGRFGRHHAQLAGHLHSAQRAAGASGRCEALRLRERPCET